MKSIWRIIRFTSELRRYYIGVAVFTILIAAVSQLVPILTKAAIDEISKLSGGGHVDITKVAIFAGLIFLTDISQTLFSNFSNYLGDMLAANQQRLLSNRYYAHVLRLPQRYFDTELTGTIISRMNRGIHQISDFTQALSNNFLFFLFSSVFTLIIVAQYSWPIALILLAMYPIFIWLTALTSEKWLVWQKEINQKSDVASGRFAESVGQVRVVKSFAQEKHELQIFGKLMNSLVKTTSPQSIYWQKHDAIRRSVLASMTFALYAFIFIEAANGKYSIGTMVLLIQYTQLMRIPLFSISYLVGQTQRAIANSKDYFTVMDEKPEITDQENAKKLDVVRGAVVFKNVTFGYDAKSPVLKDLSFDVPADSKIALVGESGQGKTTITSLLLRLYDVTSGSITIDDQNINDVTQESLRRNIAVVFQDSALFSGTIRENIAYARPNATDEEVKAAAISANAHEFISKFENQYSTEIGERGLKLSGGQKQRIAIARALLKDAPILILDEATSSLDTRSERKVQEALERLMKGRTTLIIAHRLSTIQSVDTIVTLQNGKVDECGSPEQLASSGGIYSQLLELQQNNTEKAAKKLKQYELQG
ncbi:MAG: ABC transporter ATP-binding protein [Candidatus Saccharimonadales bacterium]